MPQARKDARGSENSRARFLPQAVDVFGAAHHDQHIIGGQREMAVRIERHRTAAVFDANHQQAEPRLKFNSLSDCPARGLLGPM